MNSPTLSIVVPCFNTRATINRTLGSIYDQATSYLDKIEVIIVDDCSTDRFNYKSLEEDYQNLRVVSTPHNGGDAIARKYGIMEARGGYISFIDADDEFYPNLERFVLDKDIWNYDILAGTVISIQDNLTQRTDGGFGSLCTHGKFFRRSLLLEDPNRNYFTQRYLRLNGDVYLDLATQAYIKNKKKDPSKLHVLPFDMYKYRIYPQSFTNTIGFEFFNYLVKPSMFKCLVDDYSGILFYTRDQYADILHEWGEHNLYYLYHDKLNENCVYIQYGFNLYFDYCRRLLGLNSWDDFCRFHSEGDNTWFLLFNNRIKDRYVNYISGRYSITIDPFKFVDSKGRRVFNGIYL